MSELRVAGQRAHQNPPHQNARRICADWQRTANRHSFFSRLADTSLKSCGSIDEEEAIRSTEEGPKTIEPPGPAVAGRAVITAEGSRPGGHGPSPERRGDRLERERRARGRRCHRGGFHGAHEGTDDSIAAR